LVWLALLALLALTTASSFVRLGGWNFAINIAIACAKAGLVVWVFMHLRSGAPLIRLVAGAALAWIIILIGLSLTDLLTRYFY
jgi:cytochrome c oxidase subunit 4